MSKDQNISVILFKEKKIILFSIIAAIILGVVVTFLIPKKYSSFAIIYPANSNSLNDVTNNPDFGYEIHADRLIQLIESQIIQDSLVNKFDLLTYYELDKMKPDWRYKLNEFMARDIDINRTRFLSIVITVTTKDPDLSANMANYITQTVDIVKENILKENTKMAVDVYHTQYLSQSLKVDSLLNLIFEMSDNSSSSSNSKNILFKKRKEVIKERQKLNYYSGADDAILKISANDETERTEKIINDYYVEKDVLYDINKKYEKSIEQYNYPIPKSYIISEAKPDYRKVSPSLSRNIIIAIAIGLLSAILFILIKFKIKEIKEVAKNV
jgi:capsular polysaccharide biosynthesis protein